MSRAWFAKKRGRMDFLDLMFYDNSTRAWGLVIVTAMVVFAVLAVVRSLLLRSLTSISNRTRNYVDDLAVQAVAAIRPWLLVGVALGIAAQGLVLHPRLSWFIEHSTILLVLLQIGISGVAVIRGHVSGFSSRHLQTDASSVTTMRAVGFLATVALWAILCLMALDNFGVEITTLVAGLGIGGIAVALAVQNILGDLFASLSIVLDKPFVYGDFIVVDDMSGTVEKVGLKTTRVQSISGEQLIFSNSDLLQSRIRNYKRMQQRRAVLTIGVVYDTPTDALVAIPGMIREAIEGLEGVRFDRSHLMGLGASSIDFETVYYVESADFNLHMDRQQTILLRLIRRFQAEGLEFAFPTQTLHIADPNAASASLADKGESGNGAQAGR